jgi:translation initiation factor 5
MGRPGAIVNIAGTTPVDDPEYRYKMPTVFGKLEGRGNGSKTVIPNISDVGLSLHRDPGEVNKFFGCELGAQTTYNAETDRAIVNGHHTDKILQQLVHKYIENFVLCPNCRLPETEYKIKSGVIYHKCAACGNKDMVDMSHKLCTYILAQDKKAKADAKKAGKKKDKKKDKKKGSDDDSGDDKKKEKKDKKSKDKKKEKKDKKKEKKSKEDKSYLEDAVSGGKDEDDFGSDGEENGAAESVDDANAMALAVEATKKFLSENSDASPSAIAEKVVNEQMASGLKSQDKIHIFISAAFTPDFFKHKQVEKNAAIIAKITQGKNVMERHLISACEGLCADKPKNFAVLIKQLFDEDVLEEDTILEWAGEGRTDYTLDGVDEDQRCAMRAEAEPVVVWLQEDDSSDEDSD